MMLWLHKLLIGWLLPLMLDIGCECISFLFKTSETLPLGVTSWQNPKKSCSDMCWKANRRWRSHYSKSTSLQWGDNATSCCMGITTAVLSGGIGHKYTKTLWDSSRKVPKSYSLKANSTFFMQWVLSCASVLKTCSKFVTAVSYRFLKNSLRHTQYS